MTGAVFVSSPGGVFHDALAVCELWDGTVRWVAVDSADTRERLSAATVDWRSEVAVARPVGLVCSYRDARRALAEWRPEWVVSAGTGLAVGWFMAARRLGIPCLWVETLNLYGRQGLSASVCARLADRVIVQRPEQLGRHRRAMLIGELY